MSSSAQASAAIDVMLDLLAGQAFEPGELPFELVVRSSTAALTALSGA